MQNNYVTELSFDFEYDTTQVKKIIDGYKDINQYMIFPYPKEAIDPRLLKIVDDLGLYISHQEMFYTPPHGKLPIHVDQYVLSNMAKLNWVFGAEGSHNVWWKPKNPDPKTFKYYTTPIGTQYIYFEEKDVDEVYRYATGISTFFNAGIAHSVDNPTDEGRWCLCHCICLKGTRRMIEMPEVHKIFQNYLKN